MSHAILHPGKRPEIFLPLINVTPSDPTCVISTIEYLSDHAKRHGITPFITFDQQLWWIAYKIIKIESKLHQITMIHGGFHTRMSCLCAIESLMDGSGLEDVIVRLCTEEECRPVTFRQSSIKCCEGTSVSRTKH